MVGGRRKIGRQRRSRDLGIQFLQKTVALLLELRGIGQLLRWSRVWQGRSGRNPLRTFAGWARLKIGGVVSLAVGAGQTVTGVLRRDWCLDKCIVLLGG